MALWLLIWEQRFQVTAVQSLVIQICQTDSSTADRTPCFPFWCYRSGAASVFRSRCCQGSRHGHECFISRSELPAVSRPRQVGAEMLPEPNCLTDSRCPSERNGTESRSVGAAAPQLPGRSELARVPNTKLPLNIWHLNVFPYKPVFTSRDASRV